MYLLDTMVPSELRKERRSDPRVAQFIRTIAPEMLFLSAISILEFRLGALQQELNDPPQAQAIHRWIDDKILVAYRDRILPVTLAIADRCATLHVPTQRSERDMLIAATALVHDFTVVTRNVRHFAPTGVRLFNPWD